MANQLSNKTKTEEENHKKNEALHENENKTEPNYIRNKMISSQNLPTCKVWKSCKKYIKWSYENSKFGIMYAGKIKNKRSEQNILSHK